MRTLFTRLFCLVFFLQVIAPPALAADQLSLPAPDVEPPVIVFDEESTEIEAGTKIFTVAVTDNVGVDKVTLYYKGSTDMVYRAKSMKRSTSDPNIYTTDLALDPVISDTLEVYIRADDVSGNSIFKGQQFSPLTFTIVPADGEEVVRSVSEPEAVAGEDEGMPTWALVLIGVGVLALAGGGGGGGGDDDEPTTGTVTVTAPTP